MVTEEMYKEAQQIVKLYELQQRKADIVRSMPSLEEGMVMEYQDLGGYWYEYTEDLKSNAHFNPPRGLRVRSKK